MPNVKRQAGRELQAVLVTVNAGLLAGREEADDEMAVSYMLAEA
jgi:hypothetical protein